MSGHSEVFHCGTDRGAGQIGASDDAAWAAISCGHCGRQVNAAILARVNTHPEQIWIRCTACGLGSVGIEGPGLIPAVAYGPEIDGLPQDVASAYAEARRCMSVNANTAAELICRKILMHVGTDRTNEVAGQPFASYVSALENAGYITPSMKRWVDLIRTHANEATHQLAETDRSRAEGTVWFTGELLRVVYEMEHLAQRFAPPPPVTP